MSGVFHSPKKPKLPPVLPEQEPVTTITEEGEQARKRERKRLLMRGGRKSTFLSGIQNALKKRLGE